MWKPLGCMHFPSGPESHETSLVQVLSCYLYWLSLCILWKRLYSLHFSCLSLLTQPHDSQGSTSSGYSVSLRLDTTWEEGCIRARRTQGMASNQNSKWASQGDPWSLVSIQYTLFFACQLAFLENWYNRAWLTCIRKMLRLKWDYSWKCAWQTQWVLCRRERGLLWRVNCSSISTNMTIKQHCSWGLHHCPS